jgi:WD40 repeat protein
MRSLLALVLVAAGSVLFAAAPPPRTDRHGDPLPAGCFARLGTIRMRHAFSVRSVAFSGDGKTLVSGAGDHGLHLWDLGTGRLIRSLGNEGRLTRWFAGERWTAAVAISRDGKTVAASSPEGVCVWDAGTGRLLQRFAPGWAVQCLAFGAGGKTLTGGGGSKDVLLWDLTTGKELHRLSMPLIHARRLVYSADHKTLAVGWADGAIRTYDPATGALRQLLSGHSGPINALAFSLDGKTLASGAAEESVILWDLDSKKQRHRLSAHKGGVAGLAFLPDGKTLLSTGTQDGLIRFWEASTGKAARQIELPGGGVEETALSPDGNTLAVVRLAPVQMRHHSMIQLWDMRSKEKARPVLRLGAHAGPVHYLAFGPKANQITSAAVDGTFCVWEASTARPLLASRPPGQAWSPIALDIGGRVLAAASPKGEVILWDPLAGKEMRRLAGKGPVAAAALSNDARLLATGLHTGEIRLVEVETAKELHWLRGHQGAVMALAFTPDGSVLASSGEDVTVRLWRVKTGREERKAQGVRASPFRLAFSADGRTLAGGGIGGAARVWEASTGQLLRELLGHRGYVMGVAFSPNGRFLVAGNWMGVRLWDLATSQSCGELLGYQGDGMSLAFSADGKLLATGGADTTVLQWDVADRLRLDLAEAKAPEPLAARWADLASTDARKAYETVWSLARSPTASVGWLSKQLRPVPPANAKRVAKLIADLDDEGFETRKSAMQELEALGELAGPALRKALKTATDVDLRLRLQLLLGRLDDEAGGEQLRTLRALHVLELAGTPAARRLLAELAKGAPGAAMTRQAKASAERLARR